MTKRTDVHRPSAIDPEQYEYVAAMTRADSLGGAMILRGEREALQRHREMTGGAYSRHERGGDCHVCGAHFIDYAIFYHAPTNSYIRTGFDCAEKLGGGDRRAFEAIRTERRAMEAAKAGKLKAIGLLRAAGLLERVERRFVGGDLKGEPVAPPAGLDADLTRRVVGWGETLADLIGKLIKYGSLSEKQWPFLASLLDRIENIDETQKEREQERANADPAPEGRIQVEGEVLSVKIIENVYGITTKFLLKDDRGFKVWSTLPRGADEAEKGDRIKMTVTLKVKGDDPTFAVGSRPTKPELKKA